MFRFIVIAACISTLASSSPTEKQSTESDTSVSETNHLDVSAIQGGHGGGKSGFSAGSGLRAIAQQQAEQANNAFLSQHIAAKQAAYAAKSALAQTAAGASATAQAALVGKFILLQKLEKQVQQAHQQLQAETHQLEVAGRAAAIAQEVAQLAQTQSNALNAAINAAQGIAAHAREAASAVAVELGSQASMVGEAKRRLAGLLEQIHSAQIDFQATQAAAQQASDAALLAQSNAAQAGEKASSSAQLEGHGGGIHLQSAVDIGIVDGGYHH